MQHTARQQTVRKQPARKPLSESRFIDLQGVSFQPPYSILYVALGLDAHEPGYDEVAAAIAGIGRSDLLHDGLWKLNTTRASLDVFRDINKTMLDPRIDGSTPLFVLDTQEASARWYLQPKASRQVTRSWNKQYDLFVSGHGRSESVVSPRLQQEIEALGRPVRIGKRIQYVSASYSLKDAFRRLTRHLMPGEGLLLFDAAGNQATWQQGG